jgi:hypothetical protein
MVMLGSPVSLGGGVSVMVAGVAKVGVGVPEGVMLVSGDTLGVREKVGVGETSGVGWGGFLVSGGGVLCGVAGRVGLDVLVVFGGGSSIDVGVDLCPPVWRMGFQPCWFQK